MRGVPINRVRHIIRDTVGDSPPPYLFYSRDGGASTEVGVFTTVGVNGRLKYVLTFGFRKDLSWTETQRDPPQTGVPTSPGSPSPVRTPGTGSFMSCPSTLVNLSYALLGLVKVEVVLEFYV